MWCQADSVFHSSSTVESTERKVEFHFSTLPYRGVEVENSTRWKRFCDLAG